MKPTPPGWPRISSSLFYKNASKAIDWLCSAFGFEVRLKIEGAPGHIEHSELTFGEGLIMVGEEHPERPGSQQRKSPQSMGGGNTQALFIYVDDVEAHCAKARAAGAKIISEPKTTDYGAEYWSDRTYEVEDLEGHRWWFGQRMSTAKK